jgi:hypothetical protein
MRLRPPDLPDDLRRPALVVVGLVLLLCCGGFLVAGPFLLKGPQEPAYAARVATAAFLGRLEAADYAGAYDQLCTATRTRVSRDDFVAGASGRPRVVSYTIDAVAEVIDGGPPAVVVTATVDYATSSAAQDFRVVVDAGAWRVCGNALPA